MKNLYYIVLLVSVLSIFMFHCQQGNNTSEILGIENSSEDGTVSLDKVTIEKGSFDYDYDLESGPFSNCLTGVLMQNHGKIKANYRIILTPSGHYLETGHVDYNAYGGVTLENLSTGEIWTLQNGTNPWSWIEYDNGSFRFHYLWNEVYKLGNQVLNLHVKGFFTIDRNGNVTKNLETYSCN